MWWYRIRISSRRTANRRRASFSTKRKAAIGAGLRRVGGKLESGRDSGVTSVDLDALTGEDGVKVIELKAGDTVLEESLALEKLALDAFGMAARGESLTMAIFLLARGACGRAGGTSWML